MKPEHYLQDLFGLSPSEKLLEDFSCFYDSSLVQPGHMYLTPKYLCFHLHGQRGKEQVIPWENIIDLKKKNSAKVIPNAILVVLKDGTELFFSFINRHHCYKVMHRVWKAEHHDHEQQFRAHQVEGKGDEKSSSNSNSSSSGSSPIESNKEKNIEDFYEFKRELGSGAFSTVRSAVHKESKVTRAVKTIDKHSIKEKKEMLEREVSILKQIQHPNIISVVEIFEHPRYLHLVMELATGGELFDSIVSRGKYNEKDAARLVRQIAHAVAYLHEKGIVHRDLKPENLLLESKAENAQIKIADFGLSKMMEAQGVLQTACGTPGYVAPEVLFGDGYNQEVDCWSLGVIMYILLCGFPPFYADNNTKLFEKIMAGAYSFPSPYWDKVSEDAKDLIRHLLVVDPKQRYTSKQALQHPWLASKTQSTTDLSSALTTLKKTNEEDKKYTVVISQSSAARLALAAEGKGE